MFEKVLVALDGSELSNKALTFALDIAKKCSASITLYTVIPRTTVPVTPIPAAIGPGVAPTIMADYTKAIREGHEKMLKENLEKAKKDHPDLKIDAKMGDGRPAETIVRASKEGNYDLIIMGSRGLSGIKKVFLGSVSHGVVNHSEIPVLIIK
jgi:nucleotide-binding universal stress UspA family protein